MKYGKALTDLTKIVKITDDSLPSDAILQQIAASKTNEVIIWFETSDVPDGTTLEYHPLLEEKVVTNETVNRIKEDTGFHQPTDVTLGTNMKNLKRLLEGV